MTKNTDQMDKWAGQFGREYTDRNVDSLEEMEAMVERNYGKTRTELNKQFLKELDRSAKILEVGSNVGNQLLCLQRMGFSKLYGIELQSYAVELSKARTRCINIIEGSAFDIPFKDGSFDLVFTSGVLIHIAPSDLLLAVREIHRCTKEYIWGLEYYSHKPTEVTYRGHKNMLWKRDFAEYYLDQFEDLELAREEHLKYLDNDNVDTMFLLRKK